MSHALRDSLLQRIGRKPMVLREHWVTPEDRVRHIMNRETTKADALNQVEDYVNQEILSMSTTSAIPPDYNEACERLGLDPANPIVHQLQLKKWQVQGVSRLWV